MAAKKPDSLPVKKPPPPQPVERLETTSLEAIGATLEEEKPKPVKSDIATVIGVPALPNPTLPAEEKKSDPALASTVMAPPAKRSLKKVSVAVETPDGEPPAPPVEVLEAQRALEASPPSDAPAAAPPPSAPTRVPTPEPEPVVPTAASPIDSLKAKLDEIIKGPRPRLYMFAGIAGAVVLIFLGVIIRLIRGTSSDETASTASSASATSASSSAPPAATSTEAPVAALPAPKIPTCKATGDSKSIASRGVVAAGLELVMLDGVLALGWASGPKEATTAMLDPATGAAQSTSSLSAPAPLKRVIPRAPADRTVLDTDGKAARPIGTYEVGSSDGNVTINGKPLWKLEANGSADALRGAVTTDGIVIAYRQPGAIFAGATKGAASAAPPIRVGGLGMQVGAPAIAASGSHVIVAWADRAETSHPWGLRYFTWTLGQPPKPTEAFPLPENAMSPALVSLGGGFLLVWTEGPNEHQQVRVRVLDFDGKPKGEAMTVSPEGVHSGQGQAAVLPDGRGIVAFLADTGKAFEVRTATMRCD